MIGKVAFAALLLAGSAAALAQTGDGTPAAPVPPAGTTSGTTPVSAPVEDKMICRNSKITGSLTRTQRICMKQSEWDESRRRTGQGMTDMQRSASGGKCIPTDAMSGAC